MCASLPCPNDEVAEATGGAISIRKNPEYSNSMCIITISSDGKEYELPECNGAEFLTGVVMRVSYEEAFQAFVREAEKYFGKNFYYYEDEEDC